MPAFRYYGNVGGYAAGFMWFYYQLPDLDSVPGTETD